MATVCVWLMKMVAVLTERREAAGYFTTSTMKAPNPRSKTAETPLISRIGCRRPSHSSQRSGSEMLSTYSAAPPPKAEHA